MREERGERGERREEREATNLQVDLADSDLEAVDSREQFDDLVEHCREQQLGSGPSDVTMQHPRTHPHSCTRHHH